MIDKRWNPEDYLRFSDYRLRPAVELLGRVSLESPRIIFDLGCGTGQVTRILSDRWQSAKVYGLDHSKEMLEKAVAEPSDIIWMEADLESWVPEEKPDLIFANASLHWIENHQELFPRLIGCLRKGGCLAIQMPLSWTTPSHRLIRETLATGGSDGAAIGTLELRKVVGRKWVEEPEVYYDLLTGSTRSLDIWSSEYLQILEGENPVFDWVKATGLRPVLNGLDDLELDTFISEYKQRLKLAYPFRSNGRTLYPFRRLFLVATV